MPAETIVINILENGSRVVKRRIEEIGLAADRATRGLYLMQRALFVLGAGGIVRALVGALDALTNYENRLRLTATSAANVEKVQQSLFDVARRSRTEFGAVADVYSRTALSARNLGISQQEVLDITESLSKSAILSGANARESNAALVQLSQGLASNRLSGDELRSILEQLPYVADVIAKYMTETGKFGKVGRGELRKLGAEGKITADIIISAFKRFKPEIDAAFGNTQITIEQSFTNLKTSFLQLLDSFDDFYSVSTKIAIGIQFIADNLGNLVRTIGAATTAIALFYGVAAGRQLAASISAVNAYYSAIKDGTVVVLGSKNAEAMKAAYLAKNAQAQAVSTAAILADRNAKVLSLQAGAALLRQEIINNEFTVVNGRARSVLTGKFVSQTAAVEALNRAQFQLAVTENSLAGAQGRLAQATTAATAAQTAAAGATTTSAAAAAAASGFWARLGMRFPLLAAGVRLLTGLFTGLFAVMVANPFTALIGLIAAATVGIIFFGDKIQPIAGSLVNLQDIAIGTFQAILDWISPVTNALSSGFSVAAEAATSAWQDFSSYFDGLGSALAEGFSGTVNLIIGAAVGLSAGIIAAISGIPSAFSDIFTQAANLAIAAIEWLVNKGIAKINGLLAGMNSIIKFTGLGSGVKLLENVEVGRFKGTGAAKQYGEDVMKAVSSGMGVNYTKNIGDAVMKNATARVQNRAADAALAAKAGGNLNDKLPADLTGGTGKGGGGGGGGGGGRGKNEKDFFGQFLLEIEAMKTYGQQSRIIQNIQKGEKELKRQMTEQEKAYTAELTKRLDVAKQENAILERLRTPQEDLIIRQQAINNLFKQGALSASEYNLELARSAKLAVESGQNNTFFGGIKAGLADVALQTEDFGKNVQQWVTGSFSSATDAVVEFAKTGKVDIRQFFQDIFANLLKLATNQLIGSLFKNMFGGIGGGAAGGGGGGFFSNIFGGLFGKAHGGSFDVGGSGGTDSQLVAFKASPDERVTVQTPEQQRAAAQAMGGGGTTGTPVTVQGPPVQVQVLISENDIAGAMNGPTGDKMILRGIERQANAIRRVLGQ
jgi:tape measure domain-containing protein